MWSDSRTGYVLSTKSDGGHVGSQSSLFDYRLQGGTGQRGRKEKTQLSAKGRGSATRKERGGILAKELLKEGHGEASLQLKGIT